MNTKQNQQKATAVYNENDVEDAIKYALQHDTKVIDELENPRPRCSKEEQLRSSVRFPSSKELEREGKIKERVMKELEKIKIGIVRMMDDDLVGFIIPFTNKGEVREGGCGSSFPYTSYSVMYNVDCDIEFFDLNDVDVVEGTIKTTKLESLHLKSIHFDKFCIDDYEGRIIYNQSTTIRKH